MIETISNEAFHTSTASFLPMKCLCMLDNVVLVVEVVLRLDENLVCFGWIFADSRRISHQV